MNAILTRVIAEQTNDAGEHDAVVRAQRCRAIAEGTADPDNYEIAAAEFESLEMTNAAQRCRDRAAFYRAQRKGIKT